MMRWT